MFVTSLLLVVVLVVVVSSTSETENVCGKYRDPRSYVAEHACL